MRYPRQQVADQADGREGEKPGPDDPLDHGLFHTAEAFHGADAMVEVEMT
jgi:hypothetical protein